MLDIIKKITRSTAIYSVGQVAPKVVGLVLLPILTNAKYLSPADYGRLSMLEASSLLLVTLFGFGLNYALERWYWDKDYISKRKSVNFTLLVTITILTGLFWGILSFFSSGISQLLTGREDWTAMLNLLFLCSALESIVLLPTTLLRLEEKPLLFVISNIIRFILYLAFTIYFLVSLGHGLEGIYQARLISLAGILVILSLFLFRNIKLKFELSALKEMIIFRLPLVLSTISYIIFNITDRFSIRILSDSNFKDVGIYSLGYSMVNTVKVVIISAIWLSLRPMVYKMMNEPGNRRFYSKVMKYMIFVVTCLLLLITVFGQEIILVLTSNDIFNTSFYIIPIISVALIFDTLKEISQSIGLSVVKRTGIIAITMIIATIINIGLNILLVPKMGIYGAALSTAVSQVFFFCIIYYFSQKYYHVPYELARIFKMIFVFAALAGISLLISGTGVFLRVPAKILIAGSYPFILYFLDFYEEIEVARIKGLWKKLRNPGEWIGIISRE